MTERIHVQDVLPVHSRVSWGALFAGVFVALTVYVVMGVLGAALGLSFADQMTAETMSTSAGVWAIVSLVLALASGGCVATTCTAGETKMEATIYGVILWGVVFAMIVWMSGSVLRAGFGGALRAANVVGEAAPADMNWQAAAREAGFTQQQINQIRAEIPNASRIQEYSTEAAWWSFAGLLISLGAAIGGALLGAGPRPFFRIGFAGTTHQARPTTS